MTQPLDRILFRGKQWAVTEYGVEALNGEYPIEKSRLSEPDWEEHMSHKKWVDSGDFCYVLSKARAIFL